jgi:hypothetical protein
MAPSPQSRRRRVLVPISSIVLLCGSFGGGLSASAASKPPAKKPGKSAAIFSAAKVAGKYRFVKSTVTTKFSDGKTRSLEVPYGPNDTITFTVKKFPGTTANGSYSQTTQLLGTSGGKWYLDPTGTTLRMVTDGSGSDAIVVIRRIDQLDAKGMVWSADDQMLIDAYAENELVTDPALTGGSAFDQLVRVTK